MQLVNKSLKCPFNTPVSQKAPNQKLSFSYGTTNQAFDPNPEQDINHGKLQSISDPSDAERQSSFDSLEDEESITPTPESEYITREGKSTFYGDQPNSENPDPVDGVENGLKDNHNETNK